MRCAGTEPMGRTDSGLSVGAWPGLHLPRILFLATKLSTPVAWLELGAPTLLACCRVVVLTVPSTLLGHVTS